jgi:phage terminase large subunit
MIQINEHYKPLYLSKKRYFLVTGGRGSLKSTSVHDFLSRLTFEVGHGVLFLRYTMTSAEKSIIPEFKEAIQRNNSYKLFQFRGDRVTNLKTGSFIMFAGVKTSSGNQTATLKSIPGLTTMVIDEGEEFTKEKDFDTIDDSIRSSEAVNRVIWIMNPTTPEHFIYKRWIEPANKKIKIEGFEVTISNLDTVEHIHTTYHLAEKAGYLPESWIDKANKSKETNSKHYYHNYIGGWLEKAEGAILPNWTTGTFDESLPYCHGLDFGFNPDPCGLIRVAIDKKNKKIYAEELAYLQNLGTDDIEKLLRDRTGANEMIMADSAGKITIHDLSQRGLNIQACIKGPGSIVSGLKKIMDYELIVCGSSPNLKTELNNYIWNDKKSGIPIDKFNHLIDPLRYAFDRLERGAGGML